MLVALHGHQLRFVEVHALQIAQEGRILHKNHIPGVNQRLAEQIHGLGGAGDRQHGGDVAPQLRLHIGHEALQKRRIPLRRAILQDALAVLLQHLPGDAGHRFVRQGGQGRIAPREGNHAGLGNHLEYFADGAAAHPVKAPGEGQRVKVHEESLLCKEKHPPERTAQEGDSVTVPLPCSAPKGALSEDQTILPRCNRRTGCRLLATRVQRMARSCIRRRRTAFFHQPKALFRHGRYGYSFSSLP